MSLHSVGYGRKLLDVYCNMSILEGSNLSTSLNLQTVDQFFGWNLPMNITHLQALLSVVFHSLDTFLLKVSDGLGMGV